MNNVFLHSLIYVLGVIISAVAQVLLKKSADVQKENFLKEYLNFKTITAYSIFFVATMCTVFSYKYLPLSFGPILGTLEYLAVAILSYLFLKEKIKPKKMIGLLIILLGIIVYSV